jgi:mRNA interferase MazF
MVKRFEIYWINLDPTIGCEIKKLRPCLIISPDELNQNLNTVIIAPLTTTFRAYPSRLNLNFNGKKGQIVLDQIRTVDKSRLVEQAGSISRSTAKKVIDLLLEIFS